LRLNVQASKLITNMRRVVLVGMFLLLLSVMISHGLKLLKKKPGKDFGGNYVRVSRNP